MAHRLELAYGDACKTLPLYDKAVKTLGVGLFYFYMNSPLNRANLRRAAALLDDAGDDVQHINIQSSGSSAPDAECATTCSDAAGPSRPSDPNIAHVAEAKKSRILMPTRPGGTRWLQHTTRALTTIIKEYRHLVLHMTQVNYLIKSANLA